MLSYRSEALEPPIKVLFFISSLAGGGAERVMTTILSGIGKNRVEPVLVLLYPYDDSPYKEILPSEIKVIVVERKSDSLFSKIKQVLNFLKVVHIQKPDLILSMLTHNNIIALMAGRLFGIKVLASEHNTLSMVVKTAQGKKMMGISSAFLVKLLYRYAHRIIAVSEGVRDDLVEVFRVPVDKTEVIYNPLDVAKINELCEVAPDNLFEPLLSDKSEKKPIIISVGRLVAPKRVDILIKAFSHVIKEIDAKLLILGEGHERSALDALASSMGLNDKVFFLGFQKNPYFFISNADLFVISSDYEGLPMVMLEAMACGTPVISTDCKSGPREILGAGKYGVIVPTGDEIALAEAIITLLKDSSLRERLSKAGMERAKDFSAEKIVGQYESLIYKIINK